LTQEKGFLPVGQIKLGMHVLEANGQYGVVTGWKVVAGVKVMYNLEVAQDHTFTVGVEQWVVHNSNCGDVGGYRDLIKQGTKGDGLTPHHMPQGSLAKYYGFDYNKGGAIIMDEATHALTYNYGGRAIGTMNSIISRGLSFRQALAEAIWDYRRLVPNSNDSIRQLIQYWRDTYPNLMQK
jgi:filamentous hemagglutinin